MPEVDQTLLRSLAHRGPDGGWARSHGQWRFVQTRLAVIDLSDAVSYPMLNETRTISVLFNGEIYNHVQLRRELVARGHSFASRCDAEVIVHGWEEWGEALFPRLDGMWAIAVGDVDGSLVLARDPLGIKPLVRTTAGPPAFASDAMTLVAAGLADGEVDRPAIDEYLAFHYIPDPATGIVGIERVLPGTSVRVRPDGEAITRAWGPRAFEEPSDGGGVTVDDLGHALHSAVQRQLVADVPVGVFLSGGIDSSLVLHYAVLAGASPAAFTIGFDGHGAYDEAPVAAETARHYGVPHLVENLKPEFAETVEELAEAYDAPFADPSAIATLALARLARREVAVALSGTGGDDLFAGYYRHRVQALDRALALVPRRVLAHVASSGTNRGAERRTRVAQVRSYAVRMSRLALDQAGDRYLGLVSSSTGDGGLDTLRWVPDLEAAKSSVAARLGYDRRGDGGLDAIQAFELRSYLAGGLLVKEDRATMRHGLEGRVPLLDDVVVDLAIRTDAGQRATARQGKRLLRQLAARHLPRPVLRGPKRGFAVPLGDYLQGPWRSHAEEWLRDGPSSDLVDGTAAAASLDNPAAMPLDTWAVIALLAWERRLGRLTRDAPAVSPG